MNSSRMNTTAQQAAETVIMLAPIHASTIPTTRAAAPESGLAVALTMAGKVMTESVT